MEYLARGSRLGNTLAWMVTSWDVQNSSEWIKQRTPKSLLKNPAKLNIYCYSWNCTGYIPFAPSTEVTSHDHSNTAMDQIHVHGQQKGSLQHRLTVTKPGNRPGFAWE